MLDTGLHSDLLLRRGAKEFRVHKAIVCSQSEFFANACKPDSFKEGKEDHIDLVIGDTNIIGSLLEFLYTLDYGLDETANKSKNEPSQTTDSNDSKENRPLYHAKVYAAADFYLIPMLKQSAAEKFNAAARLAWQDDAFLEAVNYLYADTTLSGDQGLRKLVMQIILKHGAHLLIVDPDQSEFSLRKSMSEHAELGSDIVVQFLPSASIAANWKGFSK